MTLAPPAESDRISLRNVTAPPAVPHSRVRSWLPMRIAGILLLAAAASAAELDTKRIEELTGLRGTWHEAEGVFKVAAPRALPAVTVEGTALHPFLGLTTWVAFKKGTKAEAMIMGDLVLLEGEVNPVMSELLAGGVEVTALHNHFLFDEARVCFLHVGGEGKVEALASAVGKALAKTAPPEALPGVESTLDPAPLEAILGVKGTAKDGMFKVVLGRTVELACGCEAGKEMGVTTWAAFAGSAEKALVCGDFACFPGELQRVLRALRANGILVTAIHNHMTDETPRVTFVHYWGRGAAADLARALRRTLDAQAAPAPLLDFTDGALPDGWRAATTNPQGPDATWEVRDGVLSLTRTNHDSPSAFNLFWTDSVRFRDGVIECRVRADAGEVDQGGGLVWRAKGPGDYYIARYNPLERNFRLYHVKGGRRTMLADAGGVEIGAGTWFSLRVEHRGARIACFLDGKRLLEAEDATLPDVGGVGFWTKADACTSFDDLVVVREP